MDASDNLAAARHGAVHRRALCDSRPGGWGTRPDPGPTRASPPGAVTPRLRSGLERDTAAAHHAVAPTLNSAEVRRHLVSPGDPYIPQAPRGGCAGVVLLAALCTADTPVLPGGHGQGSGA